MVLTGRTLRGKCSFRWLYRNDLIWILFCEQDFWPDTMKVLGTLSNYRSKLITRGAAFARLKVGEMNLPEAFSLSSLCFNSWCIRGSGKSSCWVCVGGAVCVSTGHHEKQVSKYQHPLYRFTFFAVKLLGTLHFRREYKVVVVNGHAKYVTGQKEGKSVSLDVA